MFRAVCVTLCIFCFAGGLIAADPIDPANLEKQISEVLREVHNRGAELHNNGDAIGCYRMYQGGLMAVKGLLGHRPDVQKTIDLGSAAAEQKAPVERAFALHTTMAEVRRQLRPMDVPTANQIPTELPAPKTTPNSPPMPMPTNPNNQAPKPESPKPAPLPTPSPFALDDPKAASIPTPVVPLPSSFPAPVVVSLWDRLGGQPKVEKVVDDAVTLCMSDPAVNLSRDGKYKLDEETVAALKRKCVGYISSLSEGSVPYTGMSLREMQQAFSLKPEEFSAMMMHFRRALDGQKVPESEANALIKKMEDAKNESSIDPPK